LIYLSVNLNEYESVYDTYAMMSLILVCYYFVLIIQL